MSKSIMNKMNFTKKLRKHSQHEWIHFDKRTAIQEEVKSQRQTVQQSVDR